MEQELRNHLLALVSAYMGATGRSVSRTGHLAARDAAFFSRLEHGTANFTVRKYDEIVNWFTLAWPDGAAWPDLERRRGQCA
ncbi:hypothetical protein GJ654_10190 [Rhodoblastus acidophilus]|uniref:Transcriptional regulator n=1 Tax=Rhodoblastus acidophilus TaxID=1074 RepID=A0A6N8DL92_RHOAC|nr:hypothetical protein [Rhodoblastus acidophilus]MCW2275092.1 hypothetical protein [Rhodoblastus acidophilus]MTV31362.1 hypothetical protein [Rhodoblastus acidophilus]